MVSNNAKNNDKPTFFKNMPDKWHGGMKTRFLGRFLPLHATSQFIWHGKHLMEKVPPLFGKIYIMPSCQSCQMFF